MRELIRTAQFKKDWKRVGNSGKYQINDFLLVVEKLLNDMSLDSKCRDHELSGNWSGFMECHIKPDWLLIYKKEPDQLVLVRTGSHSELFD